MPLFEYDCPRCEDAFELLVRGGTVPRCPRCGAEDVHKRFSVPAKPGGGDGFAYPAPPPGAGGGCGQCGDPRGPGACAMDA